MSGSVPDSAGRPSPETAVEFWERHHAGRAPSAGGPNPVLVDVASGLTPGAALDLGCGAGGDVMWLAGHGWDVTAVDVSLTAVARVAARAMAAGLSERVRAERHDLESTDPGGTFDLINAHYLLSPVHFDRPAVLRRLTARLRDGGTLLLVDHASVPPWSWADPDTVFPTPHQTLSDIGLDLADWHVTRADSRPRQATGPDGRHAHVTDTVIVLTKEPR